MNMEVTILENVCHEDIFIKSEITYLIIWMH